MSSINAWNNTFLYFGYGSNLNTIRLHLNSPSARKVTVGRLKDYKLLFGHSKDSLWPGGCATIEPSPGDEVIGLVWRIDLKTLPALDSQEGVSSRCYRPFDVFVHPLEGGRPLICRTYQIVPPLSLSLPAPTYRAVIIDGAEEHSLPEAYIKKLRAVQHNADFSIVSGDMKRYDVEKAKAAKNPANGVDAEDDSSFAFKSSIHVSEGYFLYFGYGGTINSMYFKDKIPSAQKITEAKLKNYKLLPCGRTNKQKYSEVTSVPSAGDSVIGVVWRVGLEDLASLDEMKCTHVPAQHPFDVSVTALNSDQEYLCRVYKFIGHAEPKSLTSHYKQVLLDGATEGSFPQEYINKIRDFPESVDNTQIEGFKRSPSSILADKGYLMYFAYASNMQTDLFLSHIKTAEKVTVAKLQDHELHFSKSQFINPWPTMQDDQDWNFEEGGRGNMSPTLGSDTWGIVWKIKLDDLPILDCQERVHLQGYHALDVSVLPIDGKEPILCRMYRLVGPERPKPPTLCYLTTIINGAEEQNLPQEYIAKLKAAKYNDDIFIS